jgi:hypothetical protein
MAEDCLLEAVRGLRLAHPELGPKPLLAKLVTCSHGVYNTYLLPEASGRRLTFHMLTNCSCWG